MGRNKWLSMLLVGLLPLVGCQTPAEAPEHIPVGAEAGLRAPELRGTLASGEAFTLVEEGNRPTLLVFYRSSQCGLCRVQLEQMQQHLGAYVHQGVRVLAATLDEPEVSAGLRESMLLDFEVLSVDTTTFERWGVLDPSTGTPMPATYIIDSRGVIRYLHIGRNASDRTTDAGILTVLERLDIR